jgi:hypothetical protein
MRQESGGRFLVSAALVTASSGLLLADELG